MHDAGKGLLFENTRTCLPARITRQRYGNGSEPSLWLQKSRGCFYPDFVCKLTDGRILAVEYKGSHLYTDAQEKLAIGELWEKRSNGKCLFVMPTNREFGGLRAMVK